MWDETRLRTDETIRRGRGSESRGTMRARNRPRAARDLQFTGGWRRIVEAAPSTNGVLRNMDFIGRITEVDPRQIVERERKTLPLPDRRDHRHRHREREDRRAQPRRSDEAEVHDRDR